MPTKPKKTGKPVDTPPYEVNLGDRIYPDVVGKLPKGNVIRTMIVTTEPYLVGSSWKMMVTDANDHYWTLELGLDGFHVVGRSKKREAPTPEEKPSLVRGDVVQMLSCPKYPSLETHKATLTGEPYLAFGKWRVPLKYYCNGRETAIYDCSKLAFIRHAVITPSFWSSIFNKVKGRYMKLSKPAIVTLVVVGFVALIGLWSVGNYNSLVAGSNAVDNSWAHVETQYQRRFDLIGNVVESVKGSQFQEQAVFKSIADGRKQYQAAQASGNENGQAQAASQIETNLALVPRLQEQYPELKSNDQVTRLITELQGTENGIADVRNDYNDTVTNWNTNVTRFPKSIFAGAFDFHKRVLFKADSGASKAPKVDFSQVNQTVTNPAVTPKQ